MRAAALIASLACAATAAHAQDAARESRYGPAPDRAPTPVAGKGPGFTGTPYGGAMLGWSGKREIADPAAPQQAPQQQQPWWARVTPPPQAPQPPAPQPARYAPPPQSQVPPRPVPLAGAAPALPQSLYDIHPTTPTYPQAPAQPTYAPQTPPAPQQQQAALQPGQMTARTYSVGRQYGMQPDPIPAAGPSRMVLIAAPGSAPKDAAEDGPRDDRDWPAKTDKDGAQ